VSKTPQITVTQIIGEKQNEIRRWCASTMNYDQSKQREVTRQIHHLLRSLQRCYNLYPYTTLSIMTVTALLLSSGPFFAALSLLFKITSRGSLSGFSCHMITDTRDPKWLLLLLWIYWRVACPLLRCIPPPPVLEWKEISDQTLWNTVCV